MKRILLFALASFLAISFSNFSLSQIKTTKVTTSKDSPLKESFSEYELFSINSEEIYQKTRGKSENIQFSLRLGGKYDWNFLLEESGLRPEGSKTTVKTEKGINQIPASENSTYKGFLNNNSDNRVRLSIRQDEILGMVKSDGEMFFIEPASKFDKTLSNDIHVVYNVKDVIDDEHALCGLSEDKYKSFEPRKKGLQTDGTKNNRDACQLAEIAIAADGSMTVKHGSIANVEQHLLDIMNVVQDRYFDPDINIAYLITEIFIVDDPSNDPNWALGSNDFGDFLNAFTAWGPAGFSAVHDVASLWSDRNFDGGAVGLAWVGTVCTNNRYNVLQDFTPGMTQLIQLQTHELGHNWSAGHTANANNTYVMSPSIGSLNDIWIAQSETDIVSHKNSRSCLDADCNISEWDAELVSVNYPTGGLCSETFDPIVVLKNAGSETLTSVDIEYDVNGAGTQTFSWTGSLSTNATEEVTLPSITAPGGTNTFNATTVSGTINGTNADDDTSNDTASSSFNVIANGNQVTLTIVTDDYGGETAWQILDGATTVYEGGNIEIIPGGQQIQQDNDGDAYSSTTTITENMCIADGCYDFEIHDDWGDGICCDYGNGSYLLEDDASGTTLASGGAFGASESTSFCVPITTIQVTNTPTDITVSCEDSTDPANTGEMTATTSCGSGGLDISYTDNITNGSCTNEYVITRSWIATDDCGAQETHEQTITVEDNTNPVVNCGVTTDVISTSGGNATLPDYVSGSTFSDNCTANGDLTITQNPTAGTSMSAGTYNVEITAEDECGNIGSCEVEVTVENNEDITITNSPGDLTLECDESTDPSNTGEATATTSCGAGGLTVNYSDNVTPGSCANASTIERTWEITDNCGNNETVVQTITVEDNTAPIVTCGQSTDQLNTTSTVPLPDYTSGSTFNDNCTANGDLIISQSPAAGTSMSPGNYTVVISAEDECGNTGTCEVEVTVINDDGITITISPNDVTIDCDESVDPTNTGGLTAQTSCATGGLTVDYADVSDNQSCPETITRTWTITDDCGASETYEQIITVDDLTAPSANPISSANYECAADIPAPNTSLVTGVSDNCTVNPDVYFIDDVSNGQSCPETITRTYGVEDDCGNVTEITQNFIIEDVTNPTADPLNPLEFECTADVPAPSTTSLTGVSDNCSANPTVAFVGDVSDGQSCPETITRTYEVSDDCGNSIFIDQTIIVNDITAPNVTPLTTISAQCSGDVPAPNTGLVNATDNCVANPAVSHVSDVSDGQSCPETITRTYSVEDNCGNFTEVTQSIIVNDDTSPVITCDVTSETILASQGSTVPDYSSTTTASDNCTANPTVTQSPAAGSALTLGSNMVTMTATDDCGNESTCTIDVLYEDDASLDENELSSVSFYPNPTTNILNIDFGTEMKDATVVLYDANGKLIVEKKVQNKENETIDLSVFAKGMYTVIVHSKNGTTTQKVSKM